MFKKLKAWIIHKLGGVTRSEMIEHTRYNMLFVRQDYDDKTCEVFSQVDLNEYPSLQDNPKDKCYELTCRQLGKAVYPYASTYTQRTDYTPRLYRFCGTEYRRDSSEID